MRHGERGQRETRDQPFALVKNHLPCVKQCARMDQSVLERRPHPTPSGSTRPFHPPLQRRYYLHQETREQEAPMRWIPLLPSQKTNSHQPSAGDRNVNWCRHPYPPVSGITWFRLCHRVSASIRRRNLAEVGQLRPCEAFFGRPRGGWALLSPQYSLLAGTSVFTAQGPQDGSPGR